jgi:hypothetical protein
MLCPQLGEIRHPNPRIVWAAFGNSFNFMGLAVASRLARFLNQALQLLKDSAS